MSWEGDREAHKQSGNRYRERENWRENPVKMNTRRDNSSERGHIGDTSETHQRHIRDTSETHQRHIRDRSGLT
ncbi:Uncharacterized protein DAT39_010989 [Clarias magur]|uniref:Uncharacterized protein n=1 Tax=Clarias magur TaxID=1594786 RepID=A0A8J4XDQ5_CLAMG|nr:Uncharacterized protein DAT39_010989 [Clarias magur]